MHDDSVSVGHDMKTSLLKRLEMHILMCQLHVSCVILVRVLQYS